MADTCGLEAGSTLLIPVLVTGIQSAQALGPKKLFRVAVATLLDPCDKHRGRRGDAAFRSLPSPIMKR
jgi:hypothetical protein